MSGWIKTYRDMMENPIVTKDADHFAIWMELLTSAAHSDRDVMFNGKMITLHPGQLITGRNKLSQKWDINEHKIDRILKLFENEQQIEQQTTPNGRLISVKNWNKYQNSEQQNEQRVSNERATNEQRVSTIQELKELNNNNNIYINAHTREDDSETYHPYSGYEYSGRPIPTQNDVRAYFKEQDFKSSPDRFFWHHHGRGWSGVSDWQAMAQEWEMRYQERKETNAKKSAAWIPSTQRDDSEYGSMSDLEAMLLSRSVDDVVAGLRKERQG